MKDPRRYPHPAGLGASRAWTQFLAFWFQPSPGLLSLYDSWGQQRTLVNQSSQKVPLSQFSLPQTTWA